MSWLSLAAAAIEHIGPRDLSRLSGKLSPARPGTQIRMIVAVEINLPVGAAHPNVPEPARAGAKKEWRRAKMGPDHRGSENVPAAAAARKSVRQTIAALQANRAENGLTQPCCSAMRTPFTIRAAIYIPACPTISGQVVPRVARIRRSGKRWVRLFLFFFFAFFLPHFFLMTA